MIVNLSFGITNKVSQCFLNSFIPSSATLALLNPSNPKGLVTTPTTNAPDSLAILATIGAAPVPYAPESAVAPFRIAASTFKSNASFN